MKKIFLLFLFFNFPSVFSMNSIIRGGGIIGGIAMMWYGCSTVAENNGYNEELDCFKKDLKNAWESNSLGSIRIGSNDKNRFDITMEGRVIMDDILMIARRVQILQLFSYALLKEFNITCTLEDLVKKDRIKYIHNPNKQGVGKQGRKYTWHNGTTTITDFKANFVHAESDQDTTEILAELELVKNEIIMPLFENKKSINFPQP